MELETAADRPADEPAKLIEQGKAIPSVAEALAVFEEASRRAPYVPPAPPEVRFSTGANG